MRRKHTARCDHYKAAEARRAATAEATSAEMNKRQCFIAVRLDVTETCCWYFDMQHLSSAAVDWQTTESKRKNRSSQQTCHCPGQTQNSIPRKCTKIMYEHLDAGHSTGKKERNEAKLLSKRPALMILCADLRYPESPSLLH